MPTPYREFLYLDEKLVNELLAQVEDGIYDEDERTSAHGTERSRGVEASLAASPLSLSGSNSRAISGNDESRRVFRQTPESRFNRLYSALDPDLIKIDETSTQVWPRVEARTLLEVDGYVDVPTIGRAIASGDQLANMMEMMRMFAPQQVTPEAEAAISGFQSVRTMMSGSVIANVEVHADQPTFVAKLDEQWLRVAVGELEGEASIVGRVKRRWPEGEAYPLLTVPGLDVMSRKDRRAAAERGGNRNAPADIMVEGPAATLSVVAIYR
jgi:hypothetical protein